MAFKNVREKSKPYKGGKKKFFKGNNKFKGGRKEINKKTKVHIEFDVNARQEFLGGFQKRKQERKAFHKTRLQKQLTEEKHRIRTQARNTVGKMSSSHSILPELEAILNLDTPKETTESYDVGNVTVSITSLEDAIHKNVPDLPSDTSENDREDNESDMEEESEGIRNKLLTSIPQGGNIKTVLKRETNRILQQTKAYKASQRLKQKSRKFKGKNSRRKDDKTDGEAKKTNFHQVHKGKKKKGKALKGNRSVRVNSSKKK